MLSASSSFIATNCPDAILVTSLPVIGGRADDSTMAVPVLTTVAVRPMAEVVVAMTRAGRVANDCMAAMAGLTVGLGSPKTAMPDRVEAGAMSLGDLWQQGRESCETNVSISGVRTLLPLTRCPRVIG